MRLSIPLLGLLVLGSLVFPACGEESKGDEPAGDAGEGDSPGDGDGDGDIDWDLALPPDTDGLDCYDWKETIFYPLNGGDLSGPGAGWPATLTNDPSDISMPLGGSSGASSVKAAEEAGCPAFVKLECEDGTFSIAFTGAYSGFVTCCYEMRSSGALDCSQNHCRPLQETCNEENVCCGPYSTCAEGVCVRFTVP